MLTVFARRLTAAVALLCAMLLALTTHASGALAAPGSDDEGTTPSVREALDIALRDYNNAKGRLDASVQRQTALAEQMKTAELRLAVLTESAGPISATAYRGTRTHIALAILENASADDLLDSATTLQYITRRDNRQILELTSARKSYEEQKKALAEEIRLQQEQVAVMDKKRKDAEDALKRAGGGQLSTGVVPGTATASPAPRNADGSWPAESCSQKDPTNSSGCLTPRTLHAYQEALLAGYTRYAHCYRSASSGEHPKGRACDFSSAVSGFIDARATGGDKAYGDKVTGWLLANASRLGVYYVIWYKQIWMSGIGWRTYSGDGTPAGDHYNHVHLSMM